MWIARGGRAFDPAHHRRTRRQGFPASAETAQAKRAGTINHVVPNFRMCLVYASVDLSIKNDSSPYTCSHRHINQPRLIPSRSPTEFAQGGSIGIVLNCNGHAEYFLQILNRILPAPMREEVHVAKFSA